MEEKTFEYLLSLKNLSKLDVIKYDTRDWDCKTDIEKYPKICAICEKKFSFGTKINSVYSHIIDAHYDKLEKIDWCPICGIIEKNHIKFGENCKPICPRCNSLDTEIIEDHSCYLYEKKMIVCNECGHGT